MSERALKIEVPGAGQVGALQTEPSEHRSDAVFVYAPGAGSSLADPFGAYLALFLARAGLQTLRFQFPYMEMRRSVPDRNPVLEATWRAALDAARSLPGRVFAGGRSMGGRIASQVVAQDETVAGLALFAYPLHPTGKPQQRRDAHLADIRVPVLFCSGTRDTFATPEELREAVALVPGGRLHILEGADHGFNVLKASGKRREDVWQEACENLLAFIQETSACG